jgi:hypothetical protein
MLIVDLLDAHLTMILECQCPTDQGGTVADYGNITCSWPYYMAWSSGDNHTLSLVTKFFVENWNKKLLNLPPQTLIMSWSALCIAHHVVRRSPSSPYALHNMVEPQGLLTIRWYRGLANNHVYNWLQLICHLQQGAWACMKTVVGTVMVNDNIQHQIEKS